MRGNEKSCVNWSDYGARFYDPQIARFHTVDRFSEKYTNLSPYNYVANNPMNSIDINGDSIYTLFYDGTKRLEHMPEEVYWMFYYGYGLDVGYNSETQMLYLKGKVKKKLPGLSKLATERLASKLGDKNKKWDKHGILEMGYNISDKNDQQVLYGASDGKRAWIDLDDFSADDWSKNGFEFKNGLKPEVDNLISVFDHEYLGHVFLGRGLYGDGGAYTTGKVVDEVNKYRRERGQMERLHYGYAGSPIIYGNTADFKTKKEMKNYVKRLLNSRAFAFTNLAPLPYIRSQ